MTDQTSCPLVGAHADRTGVLLTPLADAHERTLLVERERDSARKLYLSAGDARDRAEVEIERLRELVRNLGSRWRENDEIGIGVALARLEEAAGLREQGHDALDDRQAR